MCRSSAPGPIIPNPIGLGIIGPGAEERHIEPRLEPHARAAVNAVVTMNNL